MLPLDKVLRSNLERKVSEARSIAEGAARSALEQLGVGEAKPYRDLSEEERDLRRQLRIHGRQMGDLRDAKTETQEIRLLTEEVAYQYWHRMLFARFLAENNLLMYPDPENPVAITLEECQELAVEEGAGNGWELAARYAARMLPQIFRPESPVFKLILPAELQQELERLVDGLPSEVFQASDSLGWVYQFWQARKKKEVNDSGVKIGALELPAVTQLFTEAYMVNFLLDNSLGAWWATRRLSEYDLGNAQSEEELRQKAALPGVPLTYLRFIKSENGKWSPAAGTFKHWPENLKHFKVMDPCCGSGHFLVAAFLMLVPMRMQLEELSARKAAHAVLRDNLHGLELDRRCVELAAFALAMTAWRFPGSGGYRPLPELHLACTGLSVSVGKEEWKSLALDKQNLGIALDWMYEEFKDAPMLGSLLNPAKSQAAKVLDWEELAPMLNEALNREQSDEEHEMGVVAHGLSKAAQLLANKYHWIITNVPYLARGKQGDKLREFCQRHYNEAKHDLATVFLDRCLEFCLDGANVSVVLPQNWLFLTSYKKFREDLLKNNTFNVLARLGPGAFETISGEVVKAILLILSREDKNQPSGLFAEEKGGNPHLIRGLDVSALRTAKEKAQQLITTEIQEVEQAKQLENPDAKILLEEMKKLELLHNFAFSYQGIKTGDDARYRFKFWEIYISSDFWLPFQGTVKENCNFGGLSDVIDWRNDGIHHARRQGLSAWGKWGASVSQMGQLPCSIYFGIPYDSNVSIIIPKDNSNTVSVFSYCSSNEYVNQVRKIDPSLAATNAAMSQVPFDLEYWRKVAEEKYPNGLPKPYSDDPTQWIFHGHPAPAGHPLQVAVARLLGYRWPAETDEKMELAYEARDWVKKCDQLLSYADEDGIVCIPSVRGEAPAADRLLNLLAAAYDTRWSTDKLSQLLKQANHEGKTLETWLRDKFFSQHCKLFHHRPFIWHIWDGLPDGFAALVNYHKFNYKNLETLIYLYIADWSKRQKDDMASGLDGAEERLAAAENLKKKLEMILAGENPYDIFVRWKPLEQQPIGWNPDLNDGVRLNIRPLMTVPEVRMKGAGVLRDRPNINWKKDRGTDVDSAPWYHVFKGERINDYHLSLAEKQTAREKNKGE